MYFLFGNDDSVPTDSEVPPPYRFGTMTENVLMPSEKKQVILLLAMCYPWAIVLCWKISPVWKFDICSGSHILWHSYDRLCTDDWSFEFECRNRQRPRLLICSCKSADQLLCGGFNRSKGFKLDILRRVTTTKVALINENNWVWPSGREKCRRSNPKLNWDMWSWLSLRQPLISVRGCSRRQVFTIR